MRNIEHDDVPLIGKTIRDNDKNSTALIIPKQFARLLDIENSKVTISLLDDFIGNRYLVVSKHHNDIVLE